jgi:hypothetical protein
MRSFTLLVRIAGLALSLSPSVAAPIPKLPVKPQRILILDNCDEEYVGKDEYEDNLTFIDITDKRLFRMTGFNNCHSFGSPRKIASDLRRDCI